MLELFRSQGCSDCLPASANLNALADRPDVLARSFAVTYWDRLGWKDTFGSPAWTVRQKNHARAAGRPQVIVNGRAMLFGSNRAQLDAALAAAGPARGGPELAYAPDGLRLSAGKTVAPATVRLVHYDPHVEGTGRLRHDAVDGLLMGRHRLAIPAGSAAEPGDEPRAAIERHVIP